jgi:DNA-nicking Smr family endonuclease
MSARRQASDDERALFRSAIGKVRRLPQGADVAPVTATPPAPEARQFEADERRVPGESLRHPPDSAEIEIGDEILYLKQGQSPRLLTRLRRGHFSIRAEIDLHRMTMAVARDAIVEFLDDCRRDGDLCVRIIHGKGLGSRQRGPVLKRLTHTLLQRRGDVLAAASARPNEGGTGAVIVLLQRS